MVRVSSRVMYALSTALLVACGGPFGDGVFVPLPDPGPASGGAGGAMAAGGAVEPGGAGGAVETGGAFVPPPEPPPGPPCLYNLDCAANEYCHIRFGTCFGLGTCQPRPVECDAAEVAPVCDCIGVQHVNPCVAAQAGRNVGYPGACGPGCNRLADCPAGLFCRLLPDFGVGWLGTCGPLPTDCGETNPVCRENAANGNAESECAAAQSDDWIVGPGPCGACVSQSECNRGADGLHVRDVCVMPAGRCGERSVGECITIGDHDRCAWSIAEGDPVPVCTCDGQTLGAACEADWRGLPVDHVGACDAAP